MNRYIMTDGVKSIDLPQYPNEAWHFYEGEPEEKEDFYAKVSSVYRAINLTASATANIPFALVKKSGKDFDISSEWENKVGFMPKPTELIRLWRMSLCMTNKAYGFMENSKADGKNLRYIVPTTITPIVDIEGLKGFERTLGNVSKDYMLGKKNPIFWMWRMDHTTELLPAKATEFQAMMAAAGILYYSDSFIQAFFKRGGIKPTMLVLKGMTNRENVEKIESVWDKIIKGGYKYLGKIFQGVDANGGLEAQTIGEGVDNLKDETLTNAKIADIAMSVGMPLSLLLSNSANYATAATEYKSWYENALAPWCSFMAEEMTDKLFKPLNLRFEFRPEMTDPGQEDEVARASAYSTYVNAGIKPSIAAQVIGMELPQGIEFEALDQMQEEKQQQAIEIMQEKQSSSDDEEKPNALQKEKVTKFVPNLDQLKEMDIWRKFAFRHLKRGEPLTFAFEVKTLPDDIAEGIRCGLELADSEEAIKAAFDVTKGWVTINGNHVLIDDNMSNEIVGQTLNRWGDVGNDIFKMNDCSSLADYKLICVSMKNGDIYASKHDGNHNDILRAIDPKYTEDDYVRFSGIGSDTITCETAYAGIIVNDKFDENKALDNIYKTLDRLIGKGLPKGTKVIIYITTTGQRIETTAKSINISDLAILELADAINKAAELSVLPEIRATEQPMIVADLEEPTNESN